MPRQPYRISFKKKPHVRFSMSDMWDVNVNGKAVGLLSWANDKDTGGYSWGADAALGLSWFNTWAEKIHFANVDDVKADCRRRLHATLTAAGVDQRKVAVPASGLREGREGEVLPVKT